jgi:hypothetical protein
VCPAYTPRRRARKAPLVCWTGVPELPEVETARPRFWKVELAMEDGTRLAMPDPRRFGRIRLQEWPEDEHPLEGLPPAREIARRLSSPPARAD